MFAAKSPPHFATLVLLTALSILSLNLFVPSLGHIAEDFQVDYAVASLSIAGYLALTAVLQLVLGPLSDRFGRRPVLLVAIAVFSLASLGAALATTIWVFLGFRLLQGGIIGAMAISRAVIRDMVEPQKTASVMGYIAMATAVAPMLGPIVGGALDQVFGWRANFYLFWVLGLSCFVLVWTDLGETNTQKSATFAAQFRAFPELLRSRVFWGYALSIAFAIGGFYTFLAGAPIVAQAALGMETSAIGIGIGSITLGFFTGSFLAGRFSAKARLITMILLGRSVALLGMLAGVGLVVFDAVTPVTFFGPVVLYGLGNGLSLPSANAGVMSVRADLAGSASGLSGALMVSVGAITTVLTGIAIGDGMSPAIVYAVMLVMVALSFAAAALVMMAERTKP